MILCMLSDEEDGGWIMSEFKVKNLMIDVVSAGVGELGAICAFPTRDCPHLSLICPGDTHICRQPTFIICDKGTIVCPAISKIDCEKGTFDHTCGPNYSTCWQSELWVVDLKRLLVNPDDIRVVREQLDHVMRAVESRGVEIAKDMQPQTRQQAEFLEQQLEVALREVQELKNQLP